jgi:hypothetical protein
MAEARAAQNRVSMKRMEKSPDPARFPGYEKDGGYYFIHGETGSDVKGHAAGNEAIGIDLGGEEFDVGKFNHSGVEEIASQYQEEGDL